MMIAAVILSALGFALLRMAAIPFWLAQKVCFIVLEYGLDPLSEDLRDARKDAEDELKKGAAKRAMERLRKRRKLPVEAILDG